MNSLVNRFILFIFMAASTAFGKFPGRGLSPSEPQPQPTPELWQCRILNPLLGARDRIFASAATRTAAVRSLTDCTTAGTPMVNIFRRKILRPYCICFINLNFYQRYIKGMNENKSDISCSWILVKL